MAVAMPVSAAFAGDGASADGSAAGSPGVISGNSVQLPVHVPVNVCGNTVDVVGLLNPSMGNTCTNGGGDAGAGASSTSGGATAQGGTKDSPGVVSGNEIQLPVHLPVNISGNSVDVVGVANPVFGNHSSNTGGHTTTTTTPPPPTTPPTVTTPPRSTPTKPKPAAPVKSRPAPRAVPEQAVGALAHTGTDLTAPAVAGSIALVVTGATLYRRCRPGRTR
ncbi:chaplin [Streptomyces sp. NPDC048297]|uniref:chaplin n=1 Tax=Streptomyces sp. NPDC048297 TaxID=3365531 RepID=UPI00371D95CE